MSRINAGKAIQDLKSQFKNVEKMKKIDVEAIPNKRLRDFARAVVWGDAASTGKTLAWDGPTPPFTRGRLTTGMA